MKSNKKRRFVVNKRIFSFVLFVKYCLCFVHKLARDMVGSKL